MITVILNNSYVEFVTRRYNTNSFDNALISLVDDWVAGKILWETPETADAFTPQWMKKNGYPDDDIEPDIDRETEIVSVTWFWFDGENELLVEGRLIKSAPVEDHEWPTMGVG